MTITDLGTTPPDLTGLVAIFGIDAGTLARYVAPAPGTIWQDPGFDDSAWSVGAWGFGRPVVGVPTLWPPDSNPGAGHSIATRTTVPAGVGDGYILLGADDLARLYIGGTLKITKASPASERWYSITADEWSSDVLAIYGEDTLGGQRAVYFNFWGVLSSPGGWGVGVIR